MNSLIRMKDNRNTDDMIVYYECRIEALQARIRELERELCERKEIQVVEFQGELWRLPRRA